MKMSNILMKGKQDKHLVIKPILSPSFPQKLKCSDILESTIPFFPYIHIRSMTNISQPIFCSNIKTLEV